MKSLPLYFILKIAASLWMEPLVQDLVSCVWLDMSYLSWAILLLFDVLPSGDLLLRTRPDSSCLQSAKNHPAITCWQFPQLILLTVSQYFSHMPDFEPIDQSIEATSEMEFANRRWSPCIGLTLKIVRNLVALRDTNCRKFFKGVGVNTLLVVS